MHLIAHILAASTTPTTAGKSSSKGGSLLPIFALVLIFGAVYLLFLRPRQQRMRQQLTASREMAIGDQVVSVGGIHGTVIALDADVAEVEVSPGVVLTFQRRAINAKPGTQTAQPQPVDDDWEIDPHDDSSPPAAAAAVEAPADAGHAAEDGHAAGDPAEAATEAPPSIAAPADATTAGEPITERGPGSENDTEG
jgi:preprotein translocase subunit YajC